MYKSGYYAAKYFNANYYNNNVGEDVAYLQLYINGSGFGLLAMDRLVTYGSAKNAVPKDAIITFRA